MNRRAFLGGTAGTGALAVAGCLERLGFEEESAWSNPPLVEDRPDAVYLPAGMEEMGSYGGASDGSLAVALSYTIPHRFWTVAGETERVDVETDDSMHLMATVWDAETDTVLPVNVGLELLRDGESVGGQLSPWPMLSQRMGFHYGDNVSLPEEGAYTARVRVGALEVRGTGAFANWTGASTLEVDFEFERSDIHDLEFDLIDENRRGDPEALSLMEHGAGDDHEDASGGDHGPGHPPTSDGPPIEDLPGDRIGTERSGDAKISAIATDADRLAGDGAYLVVCPRTPYNDVSLPFASLSVTVERDDATVLEDEPLTESLDHAFGHHYGTGIDGLESGAEITIAVDLPPQVARHDGYETAFFDFEDVSFTV
ncbi:DUF7350 domain-containing protein [Haloterrigena alkaliphila]|uniref:DUF7350 domain-containing protein n=1 Tax=Haloterrigena alkaliphila TaxID=2816475 RepID=UPI001CFFBC46|nr:hypothetical protein [Haloterrigena alkaliphila]UHQ95308.1 hypothetical protein J0X25_20790 [Haloterrigena alkaliphila]